MKIPKLTPDYKYIVGDSLVKLPKIEDNKFKLIITSPPYNIGKEYENKTSIENYLLDQVEKTGILTTFSR